jgi:hypothetical protein
MPNADQLQISPFWAPQPMDAEIPDAAHNGGDARLAGAERRHAA